MSVIRWLPVLAVGTAFASAGATLEEGFVDPPRDARPHTWYHWMNGNVTREGVTADLEAMAEIGLGGAQIFDAGCGIPPGPVEFNSPEWFAMLRHAASEARRLGLELCLPNCSGWSSSGGPWVTPADSMKLLDHTETRFSGGRVSAMLPQPESKFGFYEDIAVFAVPVPEAELATMASARGEVAIADDGAVTVSFPHPFEARGASYALDFKDDWHMAGTVTVETSEDGKDFSELLTAPLRYSVYDVSDHRRRYTAFPHPVKARSFRFRFAADRPAAVTPRNLVIEPGARIPYLAEKTMRYRSEYPADVAPVPAELCVAKGATVDLTDKMSADGKLECELPAGEWRIVRLGFAASGRKNHPASLKGVGLEVDKLSKSAVDRHFEAYVGRLMRELGPLAGNVESGLNGILVDSYEVGSQNWTQGFEHDFERRTGRPISPYLPVLAGFIVGSPEESERFLYDFRRVVADAFADSYAGELARKCHEYGLKLWLEPYGNSPTDDLGYGTPADIPMGEFQSYAGNSAAADATFSKTGPAVCLARFYGRRYAAAEAFTAWCYGGSGRWQKDPFGLKAQCDRAYCHGVNRIVYHRFVHQPWPDDRYVPGMTMGKWGMHFDRTQTWWHLAKPWIEYQSRCQFMLQEGRPVVDALMLKGEDVPASWETAALPYGYTKDVCDRRGFLTLKARDGKAVSPGGVEYAVVVTPDPSGLSDAVRAKMDELERGGVKVVRKFTPAGVEPDFACDGGEGRGVRYIHRKGADGSEWYFVAMPNEQCESIVCSFRTAGRRPELWDPEDGSMRPAAAWREKDGRTEVRLDFRPSGSVFVVFRELQKNLENCGGKTEILAFRTLKAKVTGADGTERCVAVEVPPPIAVEGGWDVEFQADRGAPAGKVRFDKLVSWPERTEEGIRYFSGTAAYSRELEVSPVPDGERLYLDLGCVMNLAEVKVNGREFPVLWKPPFAVDITDAVGRGGGIVPVEVKVTNLWPNRLIGDDALPPDCEWKDAEWRQTIARIPDWVKRGEKSPTGRHTFTTWRHWYKTDALLPSGLIGPVQFRFAVPVELSPGEKIWYNNDNSQNGKEGES